MRLHILVIEIGAHEPNAAVDVVAYSARRDHSAFIGIGGTHAADAEAIAPVDVGHGQAGVLDAGQKGDVGDLLRRLVLFELGHQRFAGEDQPVHAHALLVALGDAPAGLVNPLERSPVGVLGHDGRVLVQMSTITSASQPSAVCSTRRPW